MVYYGYDEFIKDMRILLKSAKEYEPDAIIAVARGGLAIGQFLAEGLNLRSLYTINSIHYDAETKLDFIKVYNTPDLRGAEKVLVVDDIVDSGDTMKEIVRILKEKNPGSDFKVMTLFQKESADFKADYWVKTTDEWMDFFWVSDIKK